MTVTIVIKNPKTNVLGFQLKDKAVLSGKKLVGVIEEENKIIYKFKS